MNNPDRRSRSTVTYVVGLRQNEEHQHSDQLSTESDHPHFQTPGRINGLGAHGAPARSGAGRRGPRERRAGVRGGALFNYVLKGAHMQPFRVKPSGRTAVTAASGVLALAAGLVLATARVNVKAAGSPT